MPYPLSIIQKKYIKYKNDFRDTKMKKKSFIFGSCKKVSTIKINKSI